MKLPDGRRTICSNLRGLRLLASSKKIRSRFPSTSDAMLKLLDEAMVSAKKMQAGLDRHRVERERGQ